jgi:hypothetical protein
MPQKIKLHPVASKSPKSNSKTKAKKIEGYSKKYGWLIILVFAVSTFTVLGLVFSDVSSQINNRITGRADDELAEYSRWKLQFGLRATDSDANWNLSGDGISNLNKFRANLDPRNVTDGSVILAQVANQNTLNLPVITDSNTPSRSNPDAPQINIGVQNSSSSSSSSGSGSPDILAMDTPSAPAPETLRAGLPIPNGAGTNNTNLTNNLPQLANQATNSLSKTGTTVRTGGEINTLILILTLISISSGGYMISQKFVKRNTLNTTEGEMR